AVGGERRADAGVLAAGPGEAGADPVAAIPVHAAGVDASKDPLGAVAVGGVDAGGEAVLGVVHEAHRLIVVGDDLEADDRAEALVAHHLHLVVHVDEHRGIEVAAAAPEATPAHQDPGPPLPGVRHLGVQHRQLLLAGQRADVRALVLGIADHETAHA